MDILWFEVCCIFHLVYGSLLSGVSQGKVFGKNFISIGDTSIADNFQLELCEGFDFT